MKELDLTKGSVPKVLMQFAMPYLLANVLQALYGGADLFVVGRFDDAASVAGVAIGSQVMQTVTGIILGLTAGITVLIGIATGARDEKKAAATIGSAVWLFAIIGAVLTLLMTVWHDTIATAMHTPPEAMTDTRYYLLICSLGIPFIIGYNVVFGIMRGLGDSRSPLYFVALACVINIVLDFVLVGGCHMRAAGAATATIASQGISFAAALCYLHRKGFRFPFTRRDIRLNGILSKRIIKLGTPIALQDALINISFLIITVIVNRMGVTASAALGVVEKLIVFAMLPPVAISSAVAAMTAQNYGAGLTDRMNRCLKSGIGMALVFGTAFCIYSQFLPETLMGIFTNDAPVIELGAEYLHGYSIDCIIVSFVFCINSYFSGQGNSLFPMVHSLIATFLFRIPLSWIFSHIAPTSLFPMGFAPPLATMVSLAICLWYLKIWQKRQASSGIRAEC
ncbi:MAG TPA: MATE family efflux transporter [Candidatus Avibacteroides excrementipullorum]|nr:MATE family efflux transporter [Candidatus Avibacteroides excrementipullorum]